MLAQQIVSGLAAGCIYALVALGLVIIYKTSGVVNFAHGDLATLSAFLAFAMVHGSGVPLAPAFLVALAAAAALGALLQWGILRPLRDRHALGLTIVTLGISLILYGVTGWIWGYDTKAFPEVIGGPPLTLGGTAISQANLAIFAITALLVLALYGFFQRTVLGKAVRAVAENRLAARLVGISPARVLLIAWSASAALGAVAGLLVAPITFLDPTMMADLMVKAFAAAVLGGLTSLPGAIVGGLLLGALESLVGGYLGTELRTTFAFTVIVFVLAVRPSGLFGATRAARV
jgi:branched-chain amino acid transport system permease protein